jgi:uncharacterized protein YdeI (YjbR/CyaY-like superfamily)
VRLNVYFASADEMRRWLEARHAVESEIWVEIRGRGSGTPGVSLAEALDEAMCFGWVDTMTWRVGDDAFVLRFTPGPPRDVARAEELRARGRMHAAGVRALEGQAGRR